MFKFILIFYFFSFSVLAEVQVRSSVDPSVVSPQGTLTLSVEIEYGSEGNISTPRLPKIESFDLIGQSESHQFQIIDKNISRIKRYNYRLQPLKEGKFKIGSIEVIVDGKVYNTHVVEVEVSSKVKPRSAPSPFGNLKRYFPPSIFGDEEEEEKFLPFSRRKPIREKDVFIKLEMKKTTLYLGEMALAGWFLYLPMDQSVNVRSEIVKNPELNGFWVESVVPAGSSATLPHELKNIGGKRYRKQLLTSSALFPVRTGALNIGALRIKSHFLSAFSFFGSLKVFLRESKGKKVRVLPLPTERKGSFFTEAVGDFDISAHVNKTVVSVREPIIYKVSFKGKGHPRLIRLPDLNFGDSFRLYDITESQKFSVSESVKTFEVILIPKSSGELLIPSFEITTFDSELGIYKTHILSSFTLKVTGVSVPGSYADKSKIYFDSDANAQKQEETEKKNGAADEMRLNPWVRDKTSELFIKWRKYFWPLIFGVLFVFFLWTLSRNFSFWKKSDSFKIQLRASLKRIDLAIKDKDWKESGIELNQLMYSFFSKLSGQGKAVKSWDTLLQNVNPSIRVKYESKVRVLVSRVEQLSFASFEEAKGLRNRQSVEKLKKDLVDLVQEISKEYSVG